MSYQLTHNDTIFRTWDNAFIPLDPTNTDYQQYLQWLKEGNKPLPPDTIPESKHLTPQQKLEKMGLTIEELKQLLEL